MRLFFGLSLDPGTCLGIDHWTSRSLPPMAHAVPLANYHITLVFLGNVDHRGLEQVCLAADAIRCSSFELTLNEPGFWNKPGLFWLGTDAVPDALRGLSGNLRNLASQLGYATDKRRYQPHVTLARRCDIPPPAAIEAPCFHEVFDHFTLYESVSTRTGMHYDDINHWPLG